MTGFTVLTTIENCHVCVTPTGHYCLRGTAAPEPCAAGSYTEEDGATGPEFCKTCPAGYFCEAGTATPTACDPGTMNEMVGQTSIAACQPCTAG